MSWSITKVGQYALFLITLLIVIFWAGPALGNIFSGGTSDIKCKQNSLLGDYGVSKDSNCVSDEQKKLEELNGNIGTDFKSSSKSVDIISFDKNSISKLEPEFIQKVNEVATNLQTKPEYLFAVMAFETGNSFDPCVKNRLSSATGLIQFLESTAKGLGTTTSQLCKMTRTEQMVYVEKHFLPKKGKLNSLRDVYMAVFMPSAVGKDENYVIAKKGTDDYEQNKGLDINSDGYITTNEATIKVANNFQTAGFGTSTIA